MPLTPEQKEHVTDLVERGEKLEAVRYFQNTLNVSADQALVLTEKLEEEIESSPLREKFKSLQEEVHKKPGMNVGRVVGGIFMTLGSIMLAVVVYLIYSNNQFAQRAIPVKGKVISYDSYESSDDDGGSTTMYRPTFEYAFLGKTYTHESSTSSSSPEYEIEEEVDVLVDPDDPREILIDSFWERWFLPLLLGFMGTMFAGMGYLVFRMLGKQP
jgi:Protein of unknown function (DUF3592)